MCDMCIHVYIYTHKYTVVYMFTAEPCIHIYTYVCIYEYLLSCIYIYTHTVVCIPSELPHRSTRPFSSLCCQPPPPPVPLHAEVRYTCQIAIYSCEKTLTKKMHSHSLVFKVRHMCLNISKILMKENYSISFVLFYLAGTLHVSIHI